ncbi:MAG: hypothetical protein GXO40_01750 [Epsilonproteobacteria bacterium]|nr:hypothetical protein [Campylobacterota bacterium]
MTEEIYELDGILYQDIKDLIFDKQSLENILFGPYKLIFVENEELVEFITKLTQYGYENMALDYVESIHDKILLDFSNFKTHESKIK